MAELPAGARIGRHPIQGVVPGVRVPSNDVTAGELRNYLSRTKSETVSMWGVEGS